MKKIILLLLLAFTCFVFSFSQDYRFSMMLNPQINWLKPENKDFNSEGSLLGFDIGMQVDRFFAENYAVYSGISIGTMGGKLLHEAKTTFKLEDKINVEVSPNTRIKYNLQYLNIPIGLKFKTIQIGYLTYFAQLGINNHFRMSAKGTSSDILTVLDNSDIRKEISFYNMGYAIGGGAEYNLGGKTALILGLGFESGLVDITRFSGSIHTQAVTIKAGILF